MDIGLPRVGWNVCGFLTLGLGSLWSSYNPLRSRLNIAFLSPSRWSVASRWIAVIAALAPAGVARCSKGRQGGNIGRAVWPFGGWVFYARVVRVVGPMVLMCGATLAHLWVLLYCFVNIPLPLLGIVLPNRSVTFIAVGQCSSQAF